MVCARKLRTCIAFVVLRDRRRRDWLGHAIVNGARVTRNPGLKDHPHNPELEIESERREFHRRPLRSTLSRTLSRTRQF
jgi:hypothetical protein